MSTNMGGPLKSNAHQSEVLLKNLNHVQAATPVIDYSAAGGGQIHIPTGSTITTLTYFAGYDETVTFLPLRTSAAVAVTQIVSGGNVYDLPAACFGSRLLQIVTDADGAVVIVLKG